MCEMQASGYASAPSVVKLHGARRPTWSEHIWVRHSPNVVLMGLVRHVLVLYSAPPLSQVLLCFIVPFECICCAVAALVACLNPVYAVRRVFSWASFCLFLPGLACPDRVFPLQQRCHVLARLCCALRLFEGRGFRLRWGKPRGRTAIPHEGTPRLECMCCVYTIVLHAP